MAKKTKSGQHQFSLAEELKSILDEYSQELFEDKERALDKASEYFVDKLKENSPRDTGEFANSWTRTTKYKNVRYVGNTAVGGKNQYGYNIPLSNIIEFSKNGKPFIRRTFENNKEQIIKIITEELNNGNTE